MIDTYSNKKIIRLIIALFLVVIVAIVLYSINQYNYQAGKIEIIINTVPKDAKVIIDGKNYSDGKNYIVTGEYKISVQKDGFKTVEYTQNIFKPGDEINIALTPESDSAKQWAKENKKLYSIFSNIVSLKAQKDGEAFRLINPIVNKLPDTNYLYSIGYKLDNNDKAGNTIIITIDSSQQYRQSAISKIESLGYNLADYNYEFINFNNPFKL